MTEPKPQNKVAMPSDDVKSVPPRGSGWVADPGENANSKSTRDLCAEYEARLDEVADLVARVRHEINNPLAGVLGQAQLLLREELNDRARKRAETIEELAIRLRDVVGQLRQIQKSSPAGPQTPSP